DDISDGPVAAEVTLPDGKRIPISDPKDTAWVIVAPPKYAPGIDPLVTLYDVIREVAIGAEWIADDPNVEYYRDIYPILRRAAEHAWVNDDAVRGHGYDKRGDFRVLEPKAAPQAPGSAPRLETRRKVTAKLADSEKLAAPNPDDAKERQRIFARIRIPLAIDPHRRDQANGWHMPPLSGDGGDTEEGNPKNWLTVLPSQYRKLELWKDGKFVTGRRP